MARILVVDDDTAVRTFVVRALTQRGHSVDHAADGDAALAKLETLDIGLLISDIVMPGRDGVALAREARQRYPALRVLLMTGYAAGRDQAASEASPADDIIMKPFSLKTICDTAEALLPLDSGE